MTVYVTQGEHWAVPGYRMSVHSTREGATRAAVALVNIMLRDSRLCHKATAADWEDQLALLQELHGAAHCDVWIVTQEVRED